jgi:hypothetical protein
VGGEDLFFLDGLALAGVLQGIADFAAHLFQGASRCCSCSWRAWLRRGFSQPML